MLALHFAGGNGHVSLSANGEGGYSFIAKGKMYKPKVKRKFYLI